VVYIHRRILFTHKYEILMTFEAKWMQLEDIMLS
jgi:hypothetical protein